jgi:NADPH:quinone reductase-like Zn-dependent oxidoreductase
MIQALNMMDLRPLIDVTYPLAKIVEAFQFQESGRHFGKICIEH